jgi:hypothetical protein
MDLRGLKRRLQLENRTEEQLKDVLKIEEECLRGGILAAIQKSLKDHAQTKKNMNDSVVALRSECEMAQNKVRKAASLASRRNACVAVVNNLYQVTMFSLCLARPAMVNTARPTQMLPSLFALLCSAADDSSIPHVQTMRQDEIGRGEIARGIKLLQEHSSTKDSREEIKGKCS